MTNSRTKPARRMKAAAEAPRQKRAARRAGVPAQAETAGSGAEQSTPERKDPAGKLGVVVALMRRLEGATIAQMGEATGWQAHSVRGALAGSLKKKHGLAIISEPAEGGRVYRIVAHGAVANATAEPAA